MSPPSDRELYTAELAHTDSTVREPGRSQVTQWDSLTLVITILRGGKEQRGRGRESGVGGRVEWTERRRE